MAAWQQALFFLSFKTIKNKTKNKYFIKYIQHIIVRANCPSASARRLGCPWRHEGWWRMLGRNFDFVRRRSPDDWMRTRWSHCVRKTEYGMNASGFLFLDRTEFPKDRRPPRTPGIANRGS